MDLTFLVWADTHFGYEPGIDAADLRWRVVDQMKSLAGWPYPATVGGTVGEPQFIVHLGDIVDGQGDPEVELAYYQYYKKLLPWPSYEVLGNHDMAKPMLADFVGRYGGKSYSADIDGVHLASLCIDYREHMEQGEVEAEQLEWLAADAARVGDSLPTILLLHSRLRRLVNPEAALEAARPYNTILALAGHLHKPAVDQFGGIDCVDVGHCRDHPIDAEYGRSIVVVHLTDQRLTVVPWRWDLADWERGQRWADPEEVAQRFTLIKDL